MARFWASLVGGVPLEWYLGWVTLEPPPHGQRLSFQASRSLPDDSSPPAGGGHVRFDILAHNLEAAHERVIAAGAKLPTRAPVPPGPHGTPVPWRVYHNPAGHPFCLVVR